MTTSTQSAAPPASTVPPVSFGQALHFWLKLGFISFGGPAGQIAIMQRELVDEKHWISQSRFNHALNYCMVLPGPEAQQLATYIGWLMHRTPGALVAGGLFVLPSLFIMIFLSWLYLSYGQLPLVASIFWGVQCAVAAIVVHALWRVGSRSLPSWKQNQPVVGIFIALIAISFIAITFLKFSFLWIVAAAALVGWLAARRWPDAFVAAGHGSDGAKKEVTYLIDDHTPTPAHALFSKATLLRVLLIGVALWAIGMAALVMALGWQATLTQMGWFFTKAALVTFGGAYAVLPYVVQTAVDQQQWLSAEQMMAGLALGETTPGPLIMVVCGLLGPCARAWLLAWRSGRVRGHLVHVFAKLCVHLGGRPVCRVHPRQAGFYRAAQSYQCSGGRRNCFFGAAVHYAHRYWRQSGGLARDCAHAGSRRVALSLSMEHRARDCSLRRCRPAA
jgi:chromate transporter